MAAEREMQNLLELEYKDDVRAYMSEMEVSHSVTSSPPPPLNPSHFSPARDFQFGTRLIAYFFSFVQTKTTASVDLIDQQPELQWYMRPYLVDFLIEIHQQHRLRPETLYLALNIVDRYVSKRIVFKVSSITLPRSCA